MFGDLFVFGVQTQLVTEEAVKPVAHAEGFPIYHLSDMELLRPEIKAQVGISPAFAAVGAIWLKKDWVEKTNPRHIELVVAHELGHLALKHLDCITRPGAAQEIAADRFAIEWCAASGAEMVDAIRSAIKGANPPLAKSIFVDAAFWLFTNMVARKGSRFEALKRAM